MRQLTSTLQRARTRYCSSLSCASSRAHVRQLVGTRQSVTAAQGQRLTVRAVRVRHMGSFVVCHRQAYGKVVRPISTTLVAKREPPQLKNWGALPTPDDTNGPLLLSGPPAHYVACGLLDFDSSNLITFSVSCAMTKEHDKGWELCHVPWSWHTGKERLACRVPCLTHGKGRICHVSYVVCCTQQAYTVCIMGFAVC